MPKRLGKFELPSKLTKVEEGATPTYAKFIAEPFEAGYGHTVGNSLRRVLLSSIEGAAISSIKIDGVNHEFQSIDGVVEDVTDIVLNLKKVLLVSTKREAINLATIDSTIALMFALLINASILILAAATFHKTGQTNVQELGEVHSLIRPLLGSEWAPTLFAIALLCCGLNSTVTATLAGQVVMEGFLDIRLPPWARRLMTRATTGMGGRSRITSLMVASRYSSRVKSSAVEPPFAAAASTSATRRPWTGGWLRTFSKASEKVSPSVATTHDSPEEGGVPSPASA